MTKLRGELKEAQQKAATASTAAEAAETARANAKREENRSAHTNAIPPKSLISNNPHAGCRLRKRVASLLPKGVSFDEYNARIAKLEDSMKMAQEKQAAAEGDSSRAVLQKENIKHKLAAKEAELEQVSQMAAAEHDRMLSQMKRLSGADSHQLEGMAEDAARWEEQVAFYRHLPPS